VNLINDKQQLAAFAEDVFSILAKAPYEDKRTGRRAGEESVSYILTTLREKGWRIPGQIGDFEDTLEAAGFSLRRVTKPSGIILRTFVTL
jgi:hypothetical protein